MEARGRRDGVLHLNAEERRAVELMLDPRLALAVGIETWLIILECGL